MREFIGKSNERILCKLSKSGILRLYSIVHVAMDTMKTSNFTCQSKSFISIFFTCQVSAWRLQPFSCHDLANEYTHKLPKLCSATLKSHYESFHLSQVSYNFALKRASRKILCWWGSFWVSSWSLLSSKAYRKSVNVMHQSIPPAPSPPAIAGQMPALTFPGVGHLQILHCPGPGHLPTPGPFPSFWHARGFLSECNYKEGFTGKKADWLIFQGQEYIVEGC